MRLGETAKKLGKLEKTLRKLKKKMRENGKEIGEIRKETRKMEKRPGKLKKRLGKLGKSLGKLKKDCGNWKRDTGNWKRYSENRLGKFWIRIVVSPQIVSTVGVDLILAGIYAEEKSLFMEKIVPVAIHKNAHKIKKEKQHFRFLYNTTFSKRLSLSRHKRIYINA